MEKSKNGNVRYFPAGMWLGTDGSVCIAHRGRPKFITHIRKGESMYVRLVRLLKRTSTPERIAKFEAGIPASRR